uniref:Uncharacterized protein n=1 Tax=Anguilla anguilla TaxID=7936 RepID=A0A0E9SE32_ANGAN
MQHATSIDNVCAVSLIRILLLTASHSNVSHFYWQIYSNCCTG